MNEKKPPTPRGERHRLSRFPGRRRFVHGLSAKGRAFAERKPTICQTDPPPGIPLLPRASFARAGIAVEGLEQEFVLGVADLFDLVDAFLAAPAHFIRADLRRADVGTKLMHLFAELDELPAHRLDMPFVDGCVLEVQIDFADVLQILLGRANFFLDGFAQGSQRGMNAVGPLGMPAARFSVQGVPKLLHGGEQRLSYDVRHVHLLMVNCGCNVGDRANVRQEVPRTAHLHPRSNSNAKSSADVPRIETSTSELSLLATTAVP